MLESALLFLALLVIFLFLNLLDGHSTYSVIKTAGVNSEKNPLARYLFKKIGTIKGIFVIKSILIPVILLMFYLFSFKKTEINVILAIANIFYLTIVIHNYNVVKRVKRYNLMMSDLSVDDE